MSRFNTGNPLGSGDPRDLDDNAKNADLSVNSEELSWRDRFGRDRKSFEGMEREFDSAQDSRETRFNDFISASGYQFLGDYGPGIEFTLYNQLVRDENGEFWRLSGQVDLPYVTTGDGIPEDDALVPAGDAVLRQDLSNPDKGAAMVARGVVAVGSIADLLALPEGQRKEGLRYLVKGYHAGSDVGGGSFYYDPTRAAENNYGITINGFVRTMEGSTVSAEWFGVVTDGVTQNATAYQRAIAYLESAGGGTLTTRYAPGGVVLEESISFKDGITFDGGGNLFIAIESGVYDTSGGLIVGGYLSSEGTPVELARGCRIVNCHYDGAISSGNIPRPFYLSHVFDGEITRCSVKNNANAFFVRRGWGNKVTHCHAKNLVFQFLGADGKDIEARATESIIAHSNTAEDIESYMFDLRNTGMVIVMGNIAKNCYGLIKTQGVGPATVIGNYLTIPPGIGLGMVGIQVNSSDWIIKDNTLYSESDYPVVAFYGEISNIIFSDNQIRAVSSAASGVVRFTSSFGGSSLTMSGNHIVCDTPNFAIVRADTGSSLTSSKIVGNTVSQTPLNASTQSATAVVYLQNISACDVSGNVIEVHRVVGGALDQKGIWITGGEGSQITHNIVTAGSNGGADRAIDVRGGSANNLVALNTVQSTDAALAVTVQSDAGNIRFLNMVNGAQTHMTPE